MDISLFEVVGPIMMGPSSSATAGMARIGATVHRFLTEPVKTIDLKFTPRMLGIYAGERSHFGLVGGILGLPEHDSRIKNALDMAYEKGIKVTYSTFRDPVPSHALTVKVTVGLESGKTTSITAISVGGGSISVIGIEEFDVELSGTEAYVYAWADKKVLEQMQAMFPGMKVSESEKDGKYLYYISIPPETAKEAQAKAAAVEGVTKTHYTDPIIPLGYVPHTPLFTTYDEILALSEETGKNIAELAIEYEINRSGRTREAIWDQMKEQLNVMKRVKQETFEKKITPLYGFESGNECKKLLKAYKEGKTLGGSVLPKAIAVAIGTMEYSCAMEGCIVAVPTGGSSGILPGTILTVAEDRGIPDEKLIESMFVAAAAGAVMYYHHSTFSGSAGGCQAEVGVSSAMAAGALAYLGDASTKAILHAVALAIKNIMGLICDPMRCAEIPCIKRNGIGVANAFAAADMAISGIESYIPPDEVIDAFVGIQKIMPVEMRNAGGGTTGTPTGIAAIKIIREKDKELMLPCSE